jgi:hypothetical protein
MPHLHYLSIGTGAHEDVPKRNPVRCAGPSFVVLDKVEKTGFALSTRFVLDSLVQRRQLAAAN